MSAVFSSDDDVTKKQVDSVSKEATESSQLQDVYELTRCSKWIEEHQFSKVTDAFPLSLMSHDGKGETRPILFLNFRV